MARCKRATSGQPVHLDSGNEPETVSSTPLRRVLESLAPPDPRRPFLLPPNRHQWFAMHGFDRRCCMDRAKVEHSLLPAGLRSDVKTADGDLAARVQHSVEDGHSDNRFGLLAREASRSQARTDDGLVSAHRGFNQSALSVVGLFLPAQPSSICNRKNVPVSLRWVELGLGTEYRCHMGRDNHTNVFSVTSHHIVGRHPIISTVSCDAGDCRLYLIQQRRYL